MADEEREAGVTIMLVEDDFDVRDALIPALEYDGHHVVGAANGREALEQLRAMPAPSLILLDLMMPEMNGTEFRAAQLRDPTLASIPVVIVSADVAAEQKAAALGAVGCLRKPLDIEDLLDEVRRRLPPAGPANGRAR